MSLFSKLSSALARNVYVSVVFLLAMFTLVCFWPNRPLAGNAIFAWTGVASIIFLILAMFFGGIKIRGSRYLSACASALCLILAIGLFGSLFIYIPQTFQAIAVPRDTPSSAVTLTPGMPHFMLPWETNIYSPVSTFRWMSFATSDENRPVFATIEYTGNPEDLFNVYGTPQKFFDEWESRCHKQLDQTFAHVQKDAFISLKNKCEEFVPIQELLSEITEGKPLTIRLNI